MARKYSKANTRLRKLKRQHEREINQLKQGLSEKLFSLEQQLQQLLQKNAFYQEALFNLIISENEPDSDTLIGALMTQRWISVTGLELRRALVQQTRNA